MSEIIIIWIMGKSKQKNIVKITRKDYKNKHNTYIFWEKKKTIKIWKKQI